MASSRARRGVISAYEEKIIRELEAPPGAFGLLLLQLQLLLPLSLGACCLGLLPVLLTYTFGEAIFLEMFDRMPVRSILCDYIGAVLQAAPGFP